MNRSDFLTQLQRAEKGHRTAAKSLAFLREMLGKLAAVSEGAPDATTDESAAVAEALARFPKLSLIAWRQLCSNDTLLAFLLTARQRFARTDAGNPGKGGGKRLDLLVEQTYMEATRRGFRGTEHEWALLLRICPPRD